MSQKYERFGKYILLEKLATGGMAEVWLARASQAGGIAKFVAVKKILPQYSDSPEFIQMFKDEASIAMNLSHSNIVSIYGYDKNNNQLYLVMDYVEGRNLRQILNKIKSSNHKLTTSQIVYIAKEVAAGLDHAHRCLNSATGKPLNITHRDMSPQNIMVSFEGEVKIVDFGIAKAESQIENTKTGTLKGKFGYMSPEQAEGLATDLRTDVFSLGIILWELLANDRLFIANNELNTLRKIRECQVPSLSKINPNIHPEIERITNKALSKDRSVRYQTAAAMHRDLSRFLNKHDPEFTPHDFAVFIKTLYADDILEARKKMIEYSKIPVPQDLSDDNSPNTSLEKTLVTSFAQKQKSGKQTLRQDIREETAKTVTSTEVTTFSGAISVAQSQAQFDRDNSHLPKIEIAQEAESINDKTEISFEGSSLLNLNPSGLQTVIKGDEIFSSLKNELLENNKKQEDLKVLEKDPSADLAMSISNYKVDIPQFRPGSSERFSQRGSSKRKPKSMGLWTRLSVFLAFTFITYFGLTNYFPDINKNIKSLAHTALRTIKKESEGYITLLSLSLGHKSIKDSASEVPRVDIPDFLQNNVHQRPVEVKAEPAESTLIVVQSSPSGAEIFINNQPTGQTTPARVPVPSRELFSIQLKKDRFVDFEETALSIEKVRNRFEARLQPIQIAFIDIILKPSAPDHKIYVNNTLVREKSRPLTNYNVPANKNIDIRVESPQGEIKVKTSVYLKENERQTVVLDFQ